MMLIHQGTTPTPQTEAWSSLSAEEQGAIYAAYQALNQTPGVTPGLGLAPPETATTVRVQDGRTLTTDGPFVETKEALDGYFVFEADDLDAAIEVAARARPAGYSAFQPATPAAGIEGAARVPAAGMGGAIEIRPIQEWG